MWFLDWVTIEWVLLWIGCVASCWTGAISGETEGANTVAVSADAVGDGAWSVPTKTKLRVAGGVLVEIWLDCKSTGHKDGGIVIWWGRGTEVEVECG